MGLYCVDRYLLTCTSVHVKCDRTVLSKTWSYYYELLCFIFMNCFVINVSLLNMDISIKLGFKFESEFKYDFKFEFEFEL